MDLERILEGGKNLVRTGWMQRGVPPAIGETVAQHSWEAGILAYFLSTKLSERGVKIDPYKAVTIAIFHDIGESLLGDLPKWTTQRLKNKEDLEEEAIKELGLGIELFKEYKDENSIEGKVAKFSEMLSTYLQAKRYLKMGFRVEEIIKTYSTEIEKLKREFPFSKITDTIDFIINDLFH